MTKKAHNYIVRTGVRVHIYTCTHTSGNCWHARLHTWPDQTAHAYEVMAYVVVICVGMACVVIVYVVIVYVVMASVVMASVVMASVGMA